MPLLLRARVCVGHRAHESGPVVFEPRGVIAPGPQGPEPVAFGCDERPHADHRDTALRALPFARPVRQGQKHRFALGHHGEQTERHHVAAVHELQTVVQRARPERHRLRHLLQVSRGGAVDGHPRFQVTRRGTISLKPNLTPPLFGQRVVCFY